jgi:hypothetical protein
VARHLNYSVVNCEVAEQALVAVFYTVSVFQTISTTLKASTVLFFFIALLIFGIQTRHEPSWMHSTYCHERTWRVDGTQGQTPCSVWTCPPRICDTHPYWRSSSRNAIRLVVVVPLQYPSCYGSNGKCQSSSGLELLSICILMLAFLFTEAVHGNPKVPCRVIAVREHDEVCCCYRSISRPPSLF